MSQREDLRVSDRGAPGGETSVYSNRLYDAARPRRNSATLPHAGVSRNAHFPRVTTLTENQMIVDVANGSGPPRIYDKSGPRARGGKGRQTSDEFSRDKRPSSNMGVWAALDLPNGGFAPAPSSRTGGAFDRALFPGRSSGPRAVPRQTGGDRLITEVDEREDGGTSPAAALPTRFRRHSTSAFPGAMSLPVSRPAVADDQNTHRIDRGQDSRAHMAHPAMRDSVGSMVDRARGGPKDEAARELGASSSGGASTSELQEDPAAASTSTPARPIRGRVVDAGSSSSTAAGKQQPAKSFFSRAAYGKVSGLVDLGFLPQAIMRKAGGRSSQDASGSGIGHRRARNSGGGATGDVGSVGGGLSASDLPWLPSGPDGDAAVPGPPIRRTSSLRKTNRIAVEGDGASIAASSGGGGGGGAGEATGTASAHSTRPRLSRFAPPRAPRRSLNSFLRRNSSQSWVDRCRQVWQLAKGDHLEDRAFGLFLRRSHLASGGDGGGGDADDDEGDGKGDFGDLGNAGRFTGADERSAFMIHPYSMLRVLWNRLLFLLVTYTAVWIPYWIAFRVAHPVLAALSFAVDAAFGIEVLLSFFTGFMDKDGRVVLNQRRIAQRYLRSWFAVDVFCAVPIEFLTPGNWVFVSLLKLVRLARLRKMARGAHEDRSYVTVKMLWLLLVFVFVAHWCACGLGLLGERVDGPTWITAQRDIQGPVTSQSLYLEALTHAVLILVGNGVECYNDMERAFMTCITVLGRMLEAVVIGSMAQLVLNVNRSAVRLQEHSELLDETVKYLGVDPELQAKIREHFNLLASCGHPGREGLKMMDELSPALNTLMRERLYGSMVESVPLFAELDDVFISSILRFLRPVIFNRGETVFRRGDVAHSMYFILRGSVVVLDASDAVVAMLGSGDFFGEIALIAKFRRSATIITLTVCDICSLSYEDLTKALEDFPADKQVLAQRAEERIAELTALTAQLSARNLGGLGGGGLGADTSDADPDPEDEDGDDDKEGSDGERNEGIAELVGRPPMNRGSARVGGGGGWPGGRGSSLHSIPGQSQDSIRLSSTNDVNLASWYVGM